MIIDDSEERAAYLFVYPAAADGTYLRNVGIFLPDYKAPHSRGQ
jgi:hypothetical protein